MAEQHVYFSHAKPGMFQVVWHLLCRPRDPREDIAFLQTQMEYVTATGILSVKATSQIFFFPVRRGIEVPIERRPSKTKTQGAGNMVPD